ncbi:hypothetical protein N356_gp098 [Cellulophaga phage phi14:2]|uniref:Uncharacterized protein n=1 Tax=Cellulophaga phage phi14:2 TaxID=1327990 RepID=S0A0V2_9CAUD|nr:hypothetical protein N356_gp098 [Cellulophaga phage phi14:2]AGO48991.1 hypothetical protein Phi14:2_gp113 [Cellulophaga phage phi14:2]
MKYGNITLEEIENILSQMYNPKRKFKLMTGCTESGWRDISESTCNDINCKSCRTFDKSVRDEIERNIQS